MGQPIALRHDDWILQCLGLGFSGALDVTLEEFQR
jgi:hypothetical protein